MEEEKSPSQEDTAKPPQAGAKHALALARAGALCAPGARRSTWRETPVQGSGTVTSRGTPSACAKCGERGDWIFPTFNGEPRYHKPVLIYWLMGLGNGPGRATIPSACGWSLRLPVRRPCSASRCSAGRMLGPAAEGWPGLILATAPIVVAESKLATTDATLALLLFGCQFCLWELGKRPSRALAGAVLGVHEPVDPGQGPGRAGLDRGVIALGLVLRLAHGGVEAAALAERADRLWRSSRSLGSWRSASPREASSSGSPWAGRSCIVSRPTWKRTAAFPAITRLVSALVFYPWSAFIPAALVGAWVRRKSDPHVRLS